MGLFGSLLGAGVGILGSVIGGGKNKKAIKKASAAEQAAMQQAIAEQRRQFDVTRQDYMPWMDAGKAAIGGMGDLTGLNGTEVQSTALDALRESPLFASIFDSGREAILQSASATGGVRGGNVQRGLADFGADTFAQVIQQQLANLGGISSGGAQMTGNLGGLGANMANNVSGFLTDIGKSKSGSILGRQAIRNNTMSNVQGIFGGLLDKFGGSLGSIFGGGGGGGGASEGVRGGFKFPGQGGGF